MLSQWEKEVVTGAAYALCPKQWIFSAAGMDVERCENKIILFFLPRTYLLFILGLLQKERVMKGNHVNSAKETEFHYFFFLKHGTCGNSPAV